MSSMSDSAVWPLTRRVLRVRSRRLVKTPESSYYMTKHLWFGTLCASLLINGDHRQCQASVCQHRRLARGLEAQWQRHLVGFRCRRAEIDGQASMRSSSIFLRLPGRPSVDGPLLESMLSIAPAMRDLPVSRRSCVRRLGLPQRTLRLCEDGNFAAGPGQQRRRRRIGKSPTFSRRACNCRGIRPYSLT